MELSMAAMQNEKYWLERARPGGVSYKLKYWIMEYYQLFINLYTILSSVARIL